MLAETLADDVQPARQRGIAEGANRLPWEGGGDCCKGFLGIRQLRLRFSERARNITDCITGAVHGRRPPCSEDQSSPRLISSVLLGPHAQLPPWRRPA